MKQVLLHTARSGSDSAGPTLVFLHYFGGSSREWTHVTGLLASDYACVALDLAGFGVSPASSGEITLESMADDVVRTLIAAGCESYVLVAHSMSAKIAWVMASRKSPGLDALVLVAPSPPEPEPIPDDERARLLGALGNRGESERTANGIVACALSEADHGNVVDDALRASRGVWEWWLERGSRVALTDAMPRLSLPTLVLAGEHDTPLSPAYLERAVAARIGGVRFDVVAGVKHLIPLEAPGEVAARINAFCSDNQM